MSLADQPDGEPAADPTSEVPAGAEEASLPNLAALRWPIVQALSELGRAASDDEIAEHVANSLNLTQLQRTVMIPSGRGTKLRNRIGWAVHELKEIDAVHYPSSGQRALTPLGQEVDEERIKALRRAYEASKSSTGADQPEDQERTETPAAWLIRAGRNSERYDYNIEHGLAALGWDDVPDLRNFSNRGELEDILRSDLPGSSDRSISNQAGQLWRLRTELRVGDLVS